jgi:hypothetical protein
VPRRPYRVIRLLHFIGDNVYLFFSELLAQSLRIFSSDGRPINLPSLHLTCLVCCSSTRLDHSRIQALFNVELLSVDEIHIEDCSSKLPHIKFA